MLPPVETRGYIYKLLVSTSGNVSAALSINLINICPPLYKLYKLPLSPSLHNRDTFLLLFLKTPYFSRPGGQEIASACRNLYKLRQDGMLKGSLTPLLCPTSTSANL